MTTEEKRRKHTEYMRLYRQRPEAQKRMREWWKAYRQKAERKEYMRRYRLAYYHAHPEEKVAQRTRQKTAKYREVYAEWRETNKERIAEVKRQYRLSHPEIERANSRRQRRIRRAAEKANMLAQIISAVPNLKCAICGKRMPFKDRTIDHVIPLSKGGTGDVWNLQIVHMRCNQKKGCKVPDELNFAQLQQQ